MALVVDQQQNFKHFCKICKKGFGCGRALGGHMRAHGIGDEASHVDEDDPASDWEDKFGGNVPPSNKRMYALRTNPNRLKSCRVCENCGKEFLSWKSFLEHGKCTSDDAESLISSPRSDGEDGGEGGRGCGWSKRKRSLRIKVGDNHNCPSSEEEDLANCLMMLSNGNADPILAEAEESCASASKDEERRNSLNFIAPISYRIPSVDNKAKGVAKGLFECKACKKVFNSHQALGGHRASHKKVKGCFAARLDHLDDSLENDDVITHEEFFPTKSNSVLLFDHGSNAPSASTSKRKSKVHECSICHRIFTSGQALGGHKRCHWITSSAPDTSTLDRIHQFQDQFEQINPGLKFDNSVPLDLKLDLNLPAPADEITIARRELVSQSSFEISTAIFLQSWIAKETDNDRYHTRRDEMANDQKTDIENINNEKNERKNKNKNSNGTLENVEDEADSKVKLAKLSELKDMTMSGGSSPWLQVGIGSTTDVGSEH